MTVYCTLGSVRKFPSQWLRRDLFAIPGLEDWPRADITPMSAALRTVVVVDPPVEGSLTWTLDEDQECKQWH